MNVEITKTPRVFKVEGVRIKDFGKIFLKEDEMISFKRENNKEYDFVSKEWGFYATPSVNKRLKKEGFKTAIVVNSLNQIYINVVDDQELKSFHEYLNDSNLKILCWMDNWFLENNHI